MLEFLRNNWFWIAMAVFFVWMHGSGAGCGGRRGHTGHGGGADPTPPKKDRVEGNAAHRSGLVGDHD